MYKNDVCQIKFGFWIVAFAILASVTSLTGCGGTEGLADVRGVVTLDGQPLPNAFIEFTPEGEGTISYARTAADGSYRMSFTDKEFGAFIGKNEVKINTGDVTNDGGTVKEVVPKAYNQESTLSADVKAGKNTFDFALKSDASDIEQFRDDDAAADDDDE